MKEKKLWMEVPPDMANHYLDRNSEITTQDKTIPEHIVNILTEKGSTWKSLDINFYMLYSKLFNYKKHKNYAYPSQPCSHSILSR